MLKFSKGILLFIRSVSLMSKNISPSSSPIKVSLSLLVIDSIYSKSTYPFCETDKTKASREVSTWSTTFAFVIVLFENISLLALKLSSSSSISIDETKGKFESSFKALVFDKELIKPCFFEKLS